MKAMPLLIALCLLSGCALINQMPGQREAEQRAEKLQNLNLRVMRFSDEYAGRVREGTTHFQAATTTPEERLTAQNWKVQQIESAYTIASGPNPVSNALDMVVLATLSRLVIEDVWVSELYSDRARSVLEMHRRLEENAWRLVDGVLTDTQTGQVREIINRWRAENPNVRAVAYIHFLDFAHSIGSPGPGEERNPGNLFAVLGLDPFTQLDPAIREVTQTRELAERAIFYMQRTPRLLDMQIERISYQFAVMPETKNLLTSVDHAALVGTAADRLVGVLPDLIAREREALISQLMQSLSNEQQTFSALSGDLRATLEAGTQTAGTLHAALETFDRIAARYPRRERAAKQAEASRPFDIREYVELVRELTLTTRELNTLAQNMDAALPGVRDAADAAADRFERMLDRVFVLLLLLALAAIAATLVAALLYRAVVIRMQRTADGART